ncbi:GNAT family N-acetyltransferase [Secundilactobacillus kimchicus]|uniref:GNAT family N-acetyltransferase n=1 Tax=Secundilactobacillus kimchicus TaxID=528209 RepID=UPI0024A7C5E9|nr:GNAT family N-acetyltransferase [Secundilactobacillus kimchicus]
MWQVKSFQELDAATLFEIYKLRTRVFVVAQHRVYQEVDDVDWHARHVFLQDSQGAVLAYARVYREADIVSFGRVVVTPEARGTGLGIELVQHVLAVINSDFKGLPIEIEAQVQVESFYKRLGFTSVGAPFAFESTPHIRMQHAN